MIKEVLDKILEAEREADEILSVATAMSREIELNAEGRLEAMREEKVTAAFGEAEKIMRAAKEEGERKAEEIAKINELSRKKTLAGGEKNLPRATVFVVEKCLEALK